ncbi:MAG: TonB-dependent receptor domain-containing protein [Bacteroidota bacterium]
MQPSPLIRFNILLLAIFLTISLGVAGTQGILEGKVTDKDNKDPLVGVNVVIVGTSFGAATDADGRFAINNLEAGVYTVRFSQVGYASILYKNVTIRPDLRTTLTIEMMQSAVQFKEIEVTAERPMIEKDVTSTNYSLGTSQIEKLPIQNVQDLVTMFPSVTQEGNVRGGKTTEVVYLIDGLPLQDVVSGGFGSSLPKSSITEFSVQTGGFESEYGNALSGVVNIITRRGSDQFNSVVRVERDNWLGQGWDDQINRYTETELTLAGPIVPEKLHFFTANTLSLSDTRFWQDLDRFFASPIQREFSGISKIDYTVNSKMRLTAQSIYSLKNWRDYEWSWRFNLNGLPKESKNSYRTSLILSHTLSDIVHYTLNFSDSYLISRIGDSKDNIDLTPYQYDFFLQYVTTGNLAWWAETKQNIFTTKGDLVVQPNPLNLLKFGFELNMYNISSDVIKFEPQTTYFGKVLTDAPLLNYSTTYNYLPRSGSLYMQEKLLVERDGATVNLGFRWDFLDPRSERPIVEYLPLNGDSTNLQATTTSTVKATLKQQLSPRMGLSFPLTWNTLLIMNYGHYFQFPLFDYLYSGTTPQQLRSGVNVLVGNPDLKPERTHAWEIGVKYGLDEKNLITLTYFNKEFIDQIDSKTFLSGNPRVGGDFGFAEYVNNAFASAEGLELVYTRHRSENLSGSLSYTLMKTEGVSDYVNQGINLAQWGYPVAHTPYPLSWDQRHSIKLEIDAKLPFDFSGNLIWSYATGKPYTYYPTSNGFTPLDSTRPFIPNNARLPATSFVNLKFSRKIAFSGSTSLLFYGNVTNLFNVMNSRWADSNGLIGGQLGDPSAYYEPRRFLIGVRYEMQ